MTENTPEKLDLASASIVDERLEALRGLYPEAFAEGKLDVDKLKNALGDIAEPARERYGITWAGKTEAIKAIQSRSVGTLKPDRERSVNFDTTQNLFIEGDNLEVLKLLQRSYHGRVKMIYIDPPYNTGKEFIYPDNYSEGLRDYLQFSKQVAEGGARLTSNADTNGRYHSKWLSMMYPRLFLARQLLRDDGVIFISIDDNEVHNLRLVMNEIFGEENFVATIVWEKSKKGDAKLIAINHEYILVFAKIRDAVLGNGKWRREKPGAQEVLAQYQTLLKKHKGKHEAINEAIREWYASLPDDDARKQHAHYRWSDARGLYFADNFAGPDDGRRSRPRYDIIHPVSGLPCKKPSTGWRWDEERTRQALQDDPPRIHFGPDETTVPNRKTYLHEIDSEPFASVFYRDGRAATLEVEQLIGEGIFEFPKNVEVLKSLISLVADTDGIVMDFFGGSASTAQAVLELNHEDGGSRRFLIVQLPEPFAPDSKAAIAGFGNLADVAAARIRAAAKTIKARNGGQLELAQSKQQDDGFGYHSLAASNFKVWDSEEAGAASAHGAESLIDLMKQHVQNVLPNANDDDLLFELLVKAGIDLCASREVLEIAGNTLHRIDAGRLVICLNEGLSIETIRGIIELAPKRVICLDRCFAGDDALKTNTVLEMKSHQIQFQTA